MDEVSHRNCWHCLLPLCGSHVAHIVSAVPQCHRAQQLVAAACSLELLLIADLLRAGLVRAESTLSELVSHLAAH